MDGILSLPIAYASRAKSSYLVCLRRRISSSKTCGQLSEWRRRRQQTAAIGWWLLLLKGIVRLTDHADASDPEKTGKRTNYWKKHCGYGFRF